MVDAGGDEPQQLVAAPPVRGTAGLRPARPHRRCAPGPEGADAVALRRAVAGLPARQRTAIVLRFYEHYSVAETAAAMSCAEGTVKALTHRAMTALRATPGFVAEEVTDHA